MQGRGVTNYSTSKPTHGFTTSTSEFDDALLQRGIISFEQVRMYVNQKKKEKKLCACNNDISLSS